MAMIYNSVNVIVVPIGAEQIRLELVLDNEEEASLRASHACKPYFGEKTVSAILKKIDSFFSMEFEKYDDETDTYADTELDLKGIADLFDYDNVYQKYLRNVKKVIKDIDDISGIVVFTNNDGHIDWVRYDFVKQSVDWGYETDMSDYESFSSFSKQLIRTKESLNLEESIAQNDTASEEWLNEYNDYIEQDPAITFEGSKFVFSGFGHGEELSHPVVKAVLERGGVHRSKVSSLTNYLVVDPAHAGFSKIEAAIDQKENGKNIKIIFLEDLEKALSNTAAAINSSAKSKIISGSTENLTIIKESISSNSITEDSCTQKEKNTQQKVSSETIAETGKSDMYESFIDTDLINFKAADYDENRLEKYIGSSEEVRIPAIFTKIGSNAFECSSVRKLHIPKTTIMSSYGPLTGSSIEEVFFDYGCVEILDFGLNDAVDLNRVEIPSSVKCISEDAFYFVEINELFVPEGVEVIKEGAFKATRIHHIYLPKSIKEIHNQAFDKAAKHIRIHAPEGSYARKYAEEHGIKNDSYTPEEIACGVLYNIPLNLVKVSIDDCIIAEDTNKFFGYEEGSYIDIIYPDGISRLDSIGLYTANILRTIVVPEGYTEIAEKAGSYAENLKTVVLPKSLQFMGKNAFEHCEQLCEVIIPEGQLEEIPEGAFKGCRSLTKIIIPKTVKKIAKSAFEGCESLCEVILADGALEEIAEDAFWGCKSLTRIVLPKNLRKLGIRAFNRCEMLSDIIIPMGSLEKISDDTFSRCVNLNMVVIPENIKYIGKGAFNECSGLESICIPSSVVEIGNYAFTHGRIYTPEENCASEYAKKKKIKRSVNQKNYQEQLQNWNERCKGFLNDSSNAEMLLLSRYEDFQVLQKAAKNEEAERIRREAEEAERIRREAEEAERIRREAEEAERIRREAEEAERIRREAEEAERIRRSMQQRYDNISNDIVLQLQIISENKGIFGTKAKVRKAAQAQLEILQKQLKSEFPKGRP